VFLRFCRNVIQVFLTSAAYTFANTLAASCARVCATLCIGVEGPLRVGEFKGGGVQLVYAGHLFLI